MADDETVADQPADLGFPIMPSAVGASTETDEQGWLDSLGLLVYRFERN